MRTQGQATVWGTHMGGGRARSGAGWYQPLQEWWAAHKAARREARRASLNACWDATREDVRPLHVEAAIELAIAQGVLSIATQPYALV